MMFCVMAEYRADLAGHSFVFIKMAAGLPNFLSVLLKFGK